MTGPDRNAIALASTLLEYPDSAYFARLEDIAKEASNALDPADAEKVRSFCATLQKDGPDRSREEYVRIFDHDPAGSLYLSWHRYGNDRGQGRAMAGLNGLYRAAGFEPVSGTMPDYLPRMLEFLAVCDEWALEALLDGFGPEMENLSRHLRDDGERYAAILDMALAPLKRLYPKHFKPRNHIDSTIRPMARPEPETLWR